MQQIPEVDILKGKTFSKNEFSCLFEVDSTHVKNSENKNMLHSKIWYIKRLNTLQAHLSKEKALKLQKLITSVRQ